MANTTPGPDPIYHLTLPDWTDGIPGNACISMVELSAIMGCCVTTLRNMVDAGRLPKPRGLRRFRGGMKLQFRLSDLRRFACNSPPAGV